jgi:hypothetical protein
VIASESQLGNGSLDLVVERAQAWFAQFKAQQGDHGQ